MTKRGDKSHFAAHFENWLPQESVQVLVNQGRRIIQMGLTEDHEKYRMMTVGEDGATHQYLVNVDGSGMTYQRSASSKLGKRKEWGFYCSTQGHPWSRLLREDISPLGEPIQDTIFSIRPPERGYSASWPWDYRELSYSKGEVAAFFVYSSHNYIFFCFHSFLVCYLLSEFDTLSKTGVGYEYQWCYRDLDTKKTGGFWLSPLTGLLHCGVYAFPFWKAVDFPYYYQLNPSMTHFRAQTLLQNLFNWPSLLSPLTVTTTDPIDFALPDGVLRSLINLACAPSTAYYTLPGTYSSTNWKTLFRRLLQDHCDSSDCSLQEELDMLALAAEVGFSDRYLTLRLDQLLAGMDMETLKKLLLDIQWRPREAHTLLLQSVGRAFLRLLEIIHLDALTDIVTLVGTNVGFLNQLAVVSCDIVSESLLPKQDEPVQNQARETMLGLHLCQLYENLSSSHPDLVIAVNGLEVQCHSWVVMCSWPYYSRMIASTLFENPLRLDLGDCLTAGALRAFVKYLYTECVEDITNPIDAYSIVKSAGEFGLLQFDTNTPLPPFNRLLIHCRHVSRTRVGTSYLIPLYEAALLAQDLEMIDALHPQLVSQWKVIVAQHNSLLEEFAASFPDEYRALILSLLVGHHQVLTEAKKPCNE